jgi:hypothetical protein
MTKRQTANAKRREAKYGSNEPRLFQVEFVSLRTGSPTWHLLKVKTREEAEVARMPFSGYEFPDPQGKEVCYV